MFGVEPSEYREVFAPLAISRYEQNKRAEAVDYFGLALDAATQAGDENLERKVLPYMVMIKRQQGAVAEAKSLQQRLLASVEGKFGASSIETSNALGKLADIEYQLRDLNVAERDIRKAIEIAESLDRFTAETWKWHLADVLNSKGAKHKAASTYEEVLNVRLADAGSNALADSDTHEVLVRYVGVMHELNRDVEAKKLAARFEPKLAKTGSAVGVSLYEKSLSDFQHLDTK